MPTLAPKLPWTHAFAGGYPRVGGQLLPSDPDAIDYLNRVAAADGAAVEVGVAMAIDAFVRGCKADGTWSALKASCIMCGARTIAGALVPLVGAAPTPYNFASGDYSRTTGLKGDGLTKYLDSGIGYDAIAVDDEHISVYQSALHGGIQNLIGGGRSSPVVLSRIASYTTQRWDVQGINGAVLSGSLPLGFLGASRDDPSSFSYRSNAVTATAVNTSNSKAGISTNYGVFCANLSDLPYLAPTSARLAFYSIGSAIPDLAALDSRVSTLVAAIAAAI